MENNRYREEEKELEVQEDTEVKNQEEVTEQVESPQEETKPKKKEKVLKEKIASLEEELNKVRNEMLLDRAELENFKRRMNEERIKDRKYANQSFFEELINVTDIFDKAVNSNVEDEMLKKYLLGFQMINTQLQTMMSDYGVTKIKDLGEDFNPQFHNAIEEVEVEGTPANKVVEVVIQGYMYKDRVLRPSMVKVSK